MTDGPAILYGWHTVTSALANPARRIRRLWTTENAARRLVEDGITLPPQHELVRPDAIAARLGPDAVHQGLLAEADPLAAPEIEEVADGLVLVLDQITALNTTTGNLIETTSEMLRKQTGQIHEQAASSTIEPFPHAPIVLWWR